MPHVAELRRKRSGIFIAHFAVRSAVGARASDGAAVSPKASIERRFESRLSVNILAVAARRALTILVWQAAWVMALAAVFALASGAKAGWSALAGGGIGLIWTMYMAYVLFKHSLSHGLRLSAVSFFAGWIIKITLTISFLITAFRSGAAPLPLLSGLFGAMVAYWWLAFRVKHADSADGK
jgi:ATP synthase protein I